jgi:hypothetical protein
MPLLLLASLMVTSAHASEVVLHDGPVDLARQLARDTAGIDPDSAEFLSIRDLTAGRPPTVVGRGEALVCPLTPSTRDSVQAAIRDVESSLTLLELDTAQQKLDHAVTVVTCLRDLVDPAQVGRIYYLAGLLAWYRQDEALARDDWRQAHVLDEGLTWDPQFAPDGEPLFIDARDALVDEAFAVIELIPESDVIHLDGKPVTARDGYVRVDGGVHFLQVGLEPALTVGISLETGTQSAVVLPSELRDDLLGWPLDGRGESLSKLLRLGLEDGQEVIVVRGDGVLRTTVGRSGWETLKEPTPPPEPELPTAPPPPGRMLLVAGGGAVLGGGAVSVASALQARGASKAADLATSDAEFERLETRYRNAAVSTYLGLGLVVAGVGVATFGVVQGVGVTPWMGRGGGGLGLQGRW